MCSFTEIFIDSHQLIISRGIASEGNAVRCLITLFVADIEISRVAFPTHLNGLIVILRHAFYCRQTVLIRRFIIQRGRVKTFDGDTIHQNVMQTNRCYSTRFEINRIGTEITSTGYYFDISFTCRIRSRNGYLLTRRLIYRNLRTGNAIQLLYIFKRISAESFQWLFIQINHIQISVRRHSHHKGNRICTCSTALGGYRNTLYFVLQHVQHTLRVLAFLHGHGRQLAFAFRQFVGIFQYFRIKLNRVRSVPALHRFSIEINHLQRRVRRCSKREMDDIRTARTALRTNGNLIITRQTAGQRTLVSRLELRILQLVVHFRQLCRSLRQVYPIFILRRLKTDIVTFYRQALQRVVRVSVYGESNLINGCASVSGCYRDTGDTVHARGGYNNLLEFIGSNRCNLRKRCRTNR